MKIITTIKKGYKLDMGMGWCLQMCCWWWQLGGQMLHDCKWAVLAVRGELLRGSEEYAALCSCSSQAPLCESQAPHWEAFKLALISLSEACLFSGWQQAVKHKEPTPNPTTPTPTITTTTNNNNNLSSAAFSIHSSHPPSFLTVQLFPPLSSLCPGTSSHLTFPTYSTITAHQHQLRLDLIINQR